MSDDDMFDPNTWANPPPCRIYLDKHCEIAVLVDAIDYWVFCRWCWQAKGSRRSDNIYACRTAAGPAHRSIYLHVEVLRNSDVLPPTNQHVIADHRNGDTLDCRRVNLRWATRSQNVRNIRGSRPHDLIEG